MTPHQKRIKRGDAHKMRILDYLAVTPDHVNGIAKAMDITINQSEYFMRMLLTSGHVIRDESTRLNKMYKRTKKVYHPLEVKATYEIELAPHIRIIRNLDRPGSDYAWQRKKYGSGRGLGSLQSSMSLFSLEGGL
jgi:hypothetical protein